MELGMTMNFFNNETSNLSIRVELEEGEDSDQTLTQFKERVVKEFGVTGQKKARGLETWAVKDSEKQLEEKADKIREVEQLLKIKTDELEDFIEQRGQVEERVNPTSSLIETITQFLGNCTLNEAHQVVKNYRKIQSTQLTEELDEDSPESTF